MLTKSNIKTKSDSLSQTVKTYIEQGNYESAEMNIAEAMAENPHDANPHNLMGILKEHENDHVLAMKHFRAAWALDPTFRPARFNMNKYAACFDSGRFNPDAYEDSDCKDEDKKLNLYKVEYDEHGIGRVVRRQADE